jgi:hypothetical protein
MKKFRIIKSRDKGVFSNFLQVLQCLYISELDGRIPIVDWDIIWHAQKEPHNGSTNVWEYYFEPVSSYSIDDVNPDKDSVKIANKYRKKGKNIRGWDRSCWTYKVKPPKRCLNNPSRACREAINRIIVKYIRIKKPILNKIDEFYVKNLEGFDLLGVHIRAATGWGHQRNLLFDDYVKPMKKYLLQHDNSRIFLATDYAPCLKYMRDIFGDKLVNYDCHISENGYLTVTGSSSILEKKTGGALIGEEAIIDAMLLSKCHKLVHGMSNVSASVMYLNKDIENEYIPVRKQREC